MDDETRNKQGKEKESKVQAYARMTALLTGGILAVICMTALLLVPKAVRVLDHAEQSFSALDALTKTAEQTLATASEAAESANRLVADNSDAVSEAMEKFNNVDFDALNRAIDDLADIVEPLAKVSSFFAR